MTLEQQEVMEKEVNPICKQAEMLVIRTQDESVLSQEHLKELKRRRAIVHDKFDPPVKAAHSSWKKAKDLYNFFIDPFDSAERTIKSKVVAFESEQERKRQDEARKAEAQRQAEERKRREEIEAQAKRAEEKGNLEKAEALREKAENVVVAPVFTPPPAPKVAGTQFNKAWKAEVLSLRLFCKAVVECRIPEAVIEVNQSALNNLAKVIKDTQKIEGIRFYEETQMKVAQR